jgi:hypothetical protein
MTTINVMNKSTMSRSQLRSQSGIALLVTLLVTSVLMGISATLLNVSLKQYRLAGIAESSEMAFQAAQAGLECALYHDLALDPSPFSVPGNGTDQSAAASITCMGTTDSSNGAAGSTEEQLFEFTWGDATEPVCTSVSVYKFYSDTATVPVVIGGAPPLRSPCPAGGVCTVIKSRGYNTSCANRTNTRTVERELTQVY